MIVKSIAERLVDYGTKVGYDSGEGGIFSRSDYDGKVIAHHQ